MNTLLAQTALMNDAATSAPIEATPWHMAFLCLYLGVLLLLSIYGAHRYVLVYLYYKYKKNVPAHPKQFAELPAICVQLPMFNERYVAKRIIERTCQIDYPKDKMHIQVLDDSTDDTIQIASQTVEHFRSQGYWIDYIHRTDRSGFKAGALENGLKYTKAEFVAIFDADFIPEPDILRKTVHYFTDPKVGMIQARWDHLNRGHSLLTKSQAILLDGHFMIEHTARNRSGRFMSFNGTAGMWRRSCIAQAGGWQHDTLTEDLDLSYRAQLKGWKFIFLPDVISPAELPPEINAFKQQQHRWTKGGAQTARKLLGMVMASPVGWRVKLEAFFHLTSCTVYGYIVLLSMMLGPALWLRVRFFPDHSLGRWLFDSSLFLLATCSASAFYLASQREIFNRCSDKIKYLPFLMALGIGISISNTLAAIEGFFCKGGEFVRTPKFGVEADRDRRWKKNLTSFKEFRRTYLPIIEMAFGFYMLGCVAMCIHYRMAFFSIPFLILFSVGYFYVALTSIAVRVQQSLAASRATESEPTTESLLPAPVTTNASQPTTNVPASAFAVENDGASVRPATTHRREA